MMLLADVYPGINGFLGTRGSFMLDFVFVAMFAIVPLLFFSVRLANAKRYQAHKTMQLILGAVLLLAVAAFEVDLQLITRPWTARAVASPYFDPDRKWTCTVGLCLIVHLAFAVPTAVLWIWVIARALRKFAAPPAPGPHSREHLLFAKLAATGMVGTALTGWVFYYLAFVATAIH